MSLFSKLKSRLMKSSSKIDEGLEAIVEDGGEESGAEEAFAEDVVEAAEPEVIPEPEPAPQPEPAPIPEPEPEIVPEPQSEPEVVPEIVPEPEPEIIPEITPQPVPEELPADVPQEVPVVSEPDVTPAPVEIPTEMPAELPVEIPTEIPVEDVVAAPAEAVKPGFLGRLLGRKDQKTVTRRVLDDDMLEQLEELLITADMGVETSMRVTAAMAEGRYGKKLSVEEIKRLMAREVARIMEPVAKPMPLYAKTPQVVLVVGVNGSGKTTTIGKLASQFKAAGKSVVIAAGDTFRAAAVEQLQVWGERAGVPVLTAPEGSDPASLAFDAMTKAQESGADLLMIDTAGRLQNRQDLMEELAKIVRVIRKKDESAPHNTLLVLDATTGQNALSQVETFQKLADVSGLVMTKLDGTARGGVLVSLADKFGLPIHAIGVGEQIDDLAPFDPEEFAAALMGLEV
ncbi:signal recognition particle-docking protein FtsY [Celeribacter persicus]|uniref:Signal recognition particle receptor FtsY n=1 Tax=Celeribacter persicus TaxID=1651082 RepID=A0A2T5HM22_9RHOB|nr:signal recognition particle-docking protein FtsY [Celeribacter persicus]PTQ72625.1 signal recognition particle-docking protein FtsY [Celeribacter persicus]